MRAGVRHAAGMVVPKEVGHGFTPHNVLRELAHAGEVVATADAIVTVVARSVVRGEERERRWRSPASSGGAPLPVLVLGGLALALVAAGAIGAGVRHSRSRRR